MKQNPLQRLLAYEKVRFLLVGALNTIIDFSILFTLVNVGKLPAIVANIISTSVALAVSYLLNKRSVFGDSNGHNPRQVTLFVVITLIGLWGLQGIVISIVAPWLQHAWSKELALFIAKLIASCFTLVWNYEWYNRVVFKKQKGSEHETK